MRKLDIGRVNNNKYVVSISFSNYLSDKSGMPKVIMGHQKSYNDNKISYISLFSVKKTILHDKVMLFCKYGVIIDGVFCGIYQMSQIIILLSQIKKEGKTCIDIHIHHLIYNKLTLIEELLDSSKEIPIKYFFHDYYCCCTNYNLMKGDVFCGGKGLNEHHCKGCNAFDKSKIMEERINQFFHKYESRIDFISPSETTKRIFEKFHPYMKSKVSVIPHQICSGRYNGNFKLKRSNEKIKVGFMAMPRIHKGWTTWEKLSALYGNMYDFYVFNSSNDNYKNMKHIKVAFNSDNTNAMVDALRENEIDIVILWSLCAETYSYTCFEAYSANCIIFTYKDSGNIKEFVNKNGNGLVFASENELLKFMSDKENCLNIINEVRKQEIKGPSVLKDNDKIVKLSLNNNAMNNICKKDKLVNYPLLWLLNLIWRA